MQLIVTTTNGILNMFRRYDLRQQRNALTNRGVCMLLALLFGLLFMVWTQIVLEKDLAPDLLRHLPKPQPWPDQLPGYYETWNWTSANFSEFPEYQLFIGRFGSNSSLQIPFEEHQFSADTSDRIEINRRVPDSRHLLCMVRQSEFHKRMQKEFVGNTSVIITFYNEAASVLLRTIVSILRNTPSRLLGEIIVIDDCSPKPINSTFLQGFHRKIKFKRNAKRQGVIATRSLAASFMAQSRYIVFLDSHCEVNVGWLEPLIERLVLNPGTVVSPVIDVIDANSFEYRQGSHGMRGGFDWSLQFKWFAMTMEESQYRRNGGNITRAYESPTTAGGIFAVARRLFLELGGFSKMLHTWGGESIEFSLRVWLCGGDVEIAPCSRVGHVFRTKLPYELPMGETKTNLINSKFIAEFWLAHHKPLYFEQHPSAFGLPNKTLHSEVDVINKFQCRTFRWYLENVYQELIVSSRSYAALGQLHQADRCVNVPSDPYAEPTLSPCDRRSTSWLFKRNGQIVIESEPGRCLTVASGNIVTLATDCQVLQPNQLWLRQNNTIVHRVSEKCLDVLYATATRLVITKCSLRTRRTQIWHFTVDHIQDTRG